MKKKIKNTLKNIFDSFGYKILKNHYYNQLVQNTKQATKINVNSKSNLLESFFTLLKNQNFSPKTIYDIGANKGYWTYECLKYYPNADYYLFEPQLNLKDDIHTLLKGHDNIHLFSVGLGDVNDVLKFTIHERDDSCSFSFTEQEAKAKGFKQIELPIVRLDSFVRDKDLNPPDILKIDAEGLDLKVLEGAISLLNDIEVVMLEVAIVNNRMENTALNVLNYLHDKGFKLFDITDMNRPFPNQVLWLCEFVFIKTGGVLDKNYR
jgi:FkbM family methyltransferase